MSRYVDVLSGAASPSAAGGDTPHPALRTPTKSPLVHHRANQPSGSVRSRRKSFPNKRNVRALVRDEVDEDEERTSERWWSILLRVRA